MHTLLRAIKALPVRDAAVTASVMLAVVVAGGLFALERTGTLPLRGQSMPSYNWYMDEWEMGKSPVATAKPPRWRSGKVQRRLDQRIRWYHNAASSEQSSSSFSSKRVRVHSSISRMR